MQAKIDTPSAAFEAAEALRMAPRTLYYGRTAGMRAAREAFLPMEESERKAGAQGEALYEDRLTRSRLYNGFGKAVRGLAGRVFSEPITWRDGASPAFVEWAKNIDMAGRSLDQFGYDAFVAGLVEGISYILVDFPPAVQVVDANGVERPPSLAEERALGRRPFFTHYRAASLYAMRTAVVQGRWRLLEARFRECANEADGWGEVEVERIRRFIAGGVEAMGLGGPEPAQPYARWELWVKDASLGEFVPTGEGGSLAPHVDLPIVPVYSWERVGFFEAEPPLLDLADLCVAHWQKQSNLDNGLHVSGFPMWHQAGVSAQDMESDEVEVGFGRLFRDTNPAAKMSVIASDGAIYEVLEKNLERLEERMRQMGLEPQKAQAGLTATSEQIRSDAALSLLQAGALHLQAAINEAIRLAGVWVGVENPGEVVVPHDFAPESATAADLQALAKLREGTPDNGPDLARRLYLQRFVALGVLDTDFDVEENERLLNAERTATEERDLERSKRNAIEFGLDPRTPPAPPERQEEDEDGEAEEPTLPPSDVEEADRA